MALIRLHRHVFDPLLARDEPPLVGQTRFQDGLTVTGDNAEHAVEYTPSPQLIIRWTFAILGRDLPRYAFVDVGSGRGRVVVLAARQPFASVTGIEFTREFHDDALANLDRVEPSRVRTGAIRLLHDDATRARLPDGPCAFYLFNPFGEAVMAAFRDRLAADHAANPRDMVVFYSNPVHRRLFDDDPRFKPMALPLLARFKLNWLNPHRFAAYRFDQERA